MDTLRQKINLPVGNDLWSKVAERMQQIEKNKEYVKGVADECNRILSPEENSRTAYRSLTDNK